MDRLIVAIGVIVLIVGVAIAGYATARYYCVTQVLTPTGYVCMQGSEIEIVIERPYTSIGIVVVLLGLILLGYGTVRRR